MQAVQARKLPVSNILLGRYHTDGMVFLKVGRCQETLCPQRWSRMGPQAPRWQGRRSYGPTRFGCGCHTVVLMCTRDASFGAQLDEEESWTGMIAVMQHPFSSKSGAPPAAHRGAQGRSVVAGLVSAYRLSFRNGRPHKVGQWFMKRESR